ncbi:suppressor of fused domain protein [Veillonella sp. CHU732]|uniref:suppressor of fused domain protein n=1 Tax=Veillonella sp. CHU732 TaxID=2490949 RepID=UPI000F8D081E|nr:suppressor of fused domain protein [Veillonella sp. CHU732]
MKISTKIFVSAAVMGQICLWTFAMDDIASETVHSATGTSSSDSAYGTEEGEETLNAGVSRLSFFDFKSNYPNSKFANIAPREQKEDEGTTVAKETHRYGIDAIENEVKRIHPLWENARYYTPKTAWESGGTEPLEQISIHKEEDYFHFITYGLTELHDKESKDQTKSGFGTELTLKLKRGEYKNQSEERKELLYIALLLQKFAKYIIQENSIVKPYEDTYLVKASSSRKNIGIDIAGTSNIVAFITVPDKDLQSLDTPYGRVDFIALIGITKKELQAIRNRKITEKELYEKLGTDVTSYRRKSVI